MVYAPGAYVFTDYQKLGIPFEIFLNVIQLVCLAYSNQWYITTPLAVVFFVCCIIVDHSLIERLPFRELPGVLLPCLCCRRRKRNHAPSTAAADVKEASSDDNLELQQI